MKLFSLDEIKTNDIETGNKDAADREKFTNIHLAKVESIKNLVGKLPVTGEIIFLWTLNSFNAFTFIPYVIKEIGEIDNLVFSTYSINTRIVNSLIRWMDKGKIKNVHIFISDSIKHRMPKVVDLIEGLVLARNNISINYVWNHSKITLIEANQQHLVIEGSGNFSENAQHEQYLFINDINVYNFRLKCIYDAGRNIHIN